MIHQPNHASVTKGVFMRRTALALALALLPVLAQAQLYKWVDENGRTQYSDRPPPAGIKGELVTKGRASSAAQPAAAPGAPAASAANKGGAAAANPAARELEFRKRQISAEEAQKEEEKKAKEQQAKQENCDIARARLKTLEDGGRILKYDKLGERQYLSDEEIEKEKGPARQRVEQTCK
jgi:hypothetical protein